MRRRNEVLVGILLTVATIIGVVGTIWLVRGGLEGGYPLYASFRWGENLRNGQPVLLAGVNVGYVENVELRDDGTLFVSMKVQDQYRVPQGTTATVQAVGIFGDAAIALRPAGPNRAKIAEGVGRSTARAVVIASVSILVLDAVIAAMFSSYLQA